MVLQQPTEKLQQRHLCPFNKKFANPCIAEIIFFTVHISIKLLESSICMWALIASLNVTLGAVRLTRICWAKWHEIIPLLAFQWTECQHSRMLLDKWPQHCSSSLLNDTQSTAMTSNLVLRKHKMQSNGWKIQSLVILFLLAPSVNKCVISLIGLITLTKIYKEYGKSN